MPDSGGRGKAMEGHSMDSASRAGGLQRGQEAPGEQESERDVWGRPWREPADCPLGVRE